MKTDKNRIVAFLSFSPQPSAFSLFLMIIRAFKGEL